MTSKSVLYALAVVVLTGSMAVVALADGQGMNANDPSEYSLSPDPSGSPAQTDASQIREPMETGAVPDRAVGSSEFGSATVGDEPTVEVGGLSYRLGIDTP